jgi:hypothetical protein
MKPKFGISSTFLKPSSMWRLGRQQEPHEKNDIVHASSIHGGAFVGAGSLWQKKGGAFWVQVHFHQPKGQKEAHELYVFATHYLPNCTSVHEDYIPAFFLFADSIATCRRK